MYGLLNLMLNVAQLVLYNLISLLKIIKNENFKS